MHTGNQLMKIINKENKNNFKKFLIPKMKQKTPKTNFI